MTYHSVAGSEEDLDGVSLYRQANLDLHDPIKRVDAQDAVFLGQLLCTFVTRSVARVL